MGRAHNFKDMAGLVFGRLTVIGYSRSIKNSAYWNCRCSCGNGVEVGGHAMRSGHTASCGCLHSETLAERNRKHSHAERKNKHPDYSVWKAMKKRCYNPNSPFYKNYGGRGIKVCERWRTSFQNFTEDMGRRPTGFSIDRIDNNGNYSPENCRWASVQDQANNRSNNRVLEFGGLKMNSKQWAIKLGMSPSCLRTRLHNGWPIERALTTPQKCKSSATA